FRHCFFSFLIESLAGVIPGLADSFRKPARFCAQRSRYQKRAKTLHQLSRPVNCRTRGELAENWLVMIPVVISGSLVPGMLNTLKKSILTRRNIASRSRTDLNADAFIDHSMGPSRN